MMHLVVFRRAYESSLLFKLLYIGMKTKKKELVGIKKIAAK